MANRFWVGGSGTYNDTTHWAASSGGAGGVSVPTNVDDVFFDANSFSGAGQTVTIPASVANACRNMDWTNATHSPTFSMPHAGIDGITISGNCTFISGMNLSNASPGNNTIEFEGNTSNTWTTGGLTIPFAIQVFRLDSGTLTLQDNLTIGDGNSLQVFHGTFTTNNKSLTFGNNTTFQSFTNGLPGGAINLGSSVITMNASGSGVVSFVLSTGTCNAGTSKIILTNTGSGTWGMQNDIGATLYDIDVSGAGFFDFSDWTLHTFTVHPGANIEFPDGQTLTINSLVAQGTAGNHITFRSLDPGFQYTLSASSTTLSYINVRDSVAAGTTPFVDTGGTNNGNNSGWTFPAPVSAGASVFFHLL